jgi:hypothetical protein
VGREDPASSSQVETAGGLKLLFQKSSTAAKILGENLAFLANLHENRELDAGFR